MADPKSASAQGSGHVLAPLLTVGHGLELVLHDVVAAPCKSSTGLIGVPSRAQFSRHEAHLNLYAQLLDQQLLPAKLLDLTPLHLGLVQLALPRGATPRART